MFSELVQLYQRVGVDIVGKSENPTAIRLTAELIGGSKCLLVIVEARLKCRAAQNSKKKNVQGNCNGNIIDSKSTPAFWQAARC